MYGPTKYLFFQHDLLWTYIFSFNVSQFPERHSHSHIKSIFYFFLLHAILFKTNCITAHKY